MYHCNTNNGTEHLNEDFKYEKLEGATRSSLSELLTNIIERFVPKLYMKYVEVYDVLADTKVIRKVYLRTFTIVQSDYETFFILEQFCDPTHD